MKVIGIVTAIVLGFAALIATYAWVAYVAHHFIVKYW